MDTKTRNKIMKLTAVIIWTSCLWVFVSVVFQTFVNDTSIISGVLAGLDWLLFFIIMIIAVFGSMELWDKSKY